MQNDDYQRQMDAIIMEAQNRNARLAQEVSILDQLGQSIVMGTHQLRAMASMLDYYDDARGDLARRLIPTNAAGQPFPNVARDDRRRVA